MKKKIEQTIEETIRLAEVSKDRVLPPKCTCKLRNVHHPDKIKSSVANCPLHGNNRAAWRKM